jgi:hypothetical protein
MMTRIEQGMGEEIIGNMEKILSRPGKVLLCARYDNGPGAIQAFYADNCGSGFVSWYWYKLQEGIKNPLTDTAHIVTVHESKMQIDEFLKFLVDKKAPVFKITAQFEQAIKKFMTPELALDFVQAGINLERADRGLPAIDFSGSPG